MNGWMVGPRHSGKRAGIGYCHLRSCCACGVQTGTDGDTFIYFGLALLSFLPFLFFFLFFFSSLLLPCHDHRLENKSSTFFIYLFFSSTSIFNHPHLAPRTRKHNSPATRFRSGSRLYYKFLAWPHVAPPSADPKPANHGTSQGPPISISATAHENV